MKVTSKIFLALFITLLLSCDEKIEPDSNLLGTWIWVKSTGGFAGRTDTPSSTGQQITIEFSKNRYKKYVDGDLVDDLRYVIKLDNSIFSTEMEEIIIYRNDWRQTFLVTEQSLILSDECYDCFQHEYKRE